ncbi:cell division ATP-binding protein FtsE [Roseofilum casamattae]|uniref:Cell division ATP-binding protein FtsE n=1 Tax=Roseofilum casamattae BLCC-M143 TaxID=3022442 RepID=A0ABT7BVG6_9CYAN|nr:cell division ATP-binding protein FtsE [Roseofilum casamattae]MDJ1183179.1 cell division ATP-binding protein FtsE [Roseofilum casamattae BLCC-M143]
MPTLTQAPNPFQHLQHPYLSQAAEPKSREVAISFQQVSKVYESGVRPLKQVSLTVYKGDFLFITGASGAGKSTLLKLMYGAEKPESGKTIVLGENVAQLKGDRLARLRRKIGIAFQDYRLLPQKTVAENLTFVLRAQGFRQKEIQRRLGATLKMLGLSHRANWFPQDLSGGEQQRTSLARALVGTPPLLLADEPTGNLDAHNALQVMKILQKLNRIGITVIVTTHDDRLVRWTGKPVLCLHRGGLRKLA